MTSSDSSASAAIVADRLGKTFAVAEKEPGFVGTLRHLVRRKKRLIPAVHDVSFEVARGEMVGFLGANGAGKTTTLKMLSGLLYPSAGSARVNGFVPFERRADFLRSITLVMGNKQQLMWDLPAADTFRMNAAVYGIADDDLRRRVDELADMLELKDKLKQPVRKLSLGERMKAELLAALLHEPKVLFLDEPTLGLDINAQVAVRAFLKRYNEEKRATVVLTSHYMQDIVALCQRVVVIHEGKLIHDGDLAALQKKLAPRREIKVELKQQRTREELAGALDDAASHGAPIEIKELDGRVVRLLVEPATLTHSVQRILGQLDVIDLTVQDPPIEETIGRFIGDQRAST